MADVTFPTSGDTFDFTNDIVGTTGLGLAQTIDPAHGRPVEPLWDRVLWNIINEAGTVAANSSAAQQAATDAGAFLRATTSTSEVTIGTGAITFVTADVRQFTTADFVLAVNAANENEWMLGQVTSWDSGTQTLQINVEAGETNGSGTFSSWNLNIVGPRGVQGASGADGADGLGMPVPTANGFGQIPVQNDADDNFQFLPQGDDGAVLESKGNNALPVYSIPAYHESAIIPSNASGGSTIANGDYVIGYSNKAKTLTEAALVALAGTATIELYLSTDHTSANGILITGGSFTVSNAVDQNPLTAANVIANDVGRYLVAKVTNANALQAVSVELTYTKKGSA